MATVTTRDFTTYLSRVVHFYHLYRKPLESAKIYQEKLTNPICLGGPGTAMCTDLGAWPIMMAMDSVGKFSLLGSKCHFRNFDSALKVLSHEFDFECLLLKVS